MGSEVRGRQAWSKNDRCEIMREDGTDALKNGSEVHRPPAAVGANLSLRLGTFFCYIRPQPLLAEGPGGDWDIYAPGGRPAWRDRCDAFLYFFCFLALKKTTINRKPLDVTVWISEPQPTQLHHRLCFS